MNPLELHEITTSAEEWGYKTLHEPWSRGVDVEVTFPSGTMNIHCDDADTLSAFFSLLRSTIDVARFMEFMPRDIQVRWMTDLNTTENGEQADELKAVAHKAINLFVEYEDERDNPRQDAVNDAINLYTQGGAK